LYADFVHRRRILGTFGEHVKIATIQRFARVTLTKCQCLFPLTCNWLFSLLASRLTDETGPLFRRWKQTRLLHRGASWADSEVKNM